jgi:tetratricopeptide (TPR) repeat protein
VIIVIAILGLALGCWWLRKQLSIQEQGRGATIRLRLYAWNYAGSMLMDTPLAGQEEKEALGSRMLPLIVGQGEGTYILYAQQLSRRHAEQDPQAFQGQVLAHAHNHWLETMAELGAIGLALVATGLGVTIWAGIVTLRGDMEPIDRWCLVGLLGALTAIMFGETFNVGLNKPGPPMFFYTLVGLTWGMARSYLPRHAPKKQGAHRLVRASGLAVVLVSAAVVVSISWRNWEGALAYKKIEQQVNEGNWEQALAYSEEAARARLTPADRLLALNGRLSAMQSAANVQVQRITQMIQRTQGREVDSNIRTLAREDSNAFQRYAQECIHTGQRMWNLVPAYPRVAFRVSQCWLMRGQMEQALKALGLKEEASQYIQPVREWLYREYFYHRLNRYLAFRMLRFAGGWPLSKRLDILRMPLRVTQADDEFEQVLAGYLDEQNFDQQMNELLSRAQAIQQHPEKRPWPDAYAPETFRLAALARKLRGAFEQAAELAQQGKKLSAFVDHRFPAVTLRAQLEQAHYLFLAQPDKPEKSIQMSQAAVDAWPEQAVGQTDLEPMRQRIWLYMLAGGQEQRVREILKKRVAHLQGQELKADLDQGLAELYTRLAQMFGGFPDRKRPMAFEEWLERATALSPQWPQSHLVAARYYLEKGVDAKAVRHLKILNRIFEQAPARMQRVLQSLRQRFPNNYALQGFIDKWVRSLQTRPAEQEGQNNSN